jgi:hypothetical protein
MTTPHRPGILERHAGHPAYVIDASTLRCHQCQQTIDLSRLFRPSKVGSTSGTSQTRAPSDPRPEQTCHQHPGEFAGGCRCCAADRHALDPTAPPLISQVRTGSDPTDLEIWQTTKTELAAKLTAKKLLQAAEDKAERLRAEQHEDATIGEGNPS